MIWSKGKTGGAVVSDVPHTELSISTGHGDIEYYGGYLVAESIPEQYINLISAAPDLLDACKQIHRAIWAKGSSALFGEESKKLKEAIKKAEGGTR